MTVAHRMKRAIDTLRETWGTPYETNARNALLALVHQAAGDGPLRQPAGTLAMKRAVQDRRPAHNRSIPPGRHPWRGYPRPPRVSAQTGAATGGALMVMIMIAIAVISTVFVILGLWALGGAILSSHDQRTWRAKRRELNDSVEARRLR